MADNRPFGNTKFWRQIDRKILQPLDDEARDVYKKIVHWVYDKGLGVPEAYHYIDDDSARSIVLLRWPNHRNVHVTMSARPCELLISTKDHNYEVSPDDITDRMQVVLDLLCKDLAPR